MRRIAVLGSTGSVGANTLRVVARHPDRFRVTVLAAGRNTQVLAEQVEQFQPTVVVLGDATRAAALQQQLASVPWRPEVLTGAGGLCAAVARPDVDVVMAAMSGSAGLLPLLAAIRAGKNIALANKEALVMAGALVMEQVRRCGVAMVPVDSEHSAIFQALAGHRRDAVSRIYLTGSGGPLREHPPDALADASRETVLSHPRWSMGPKITVDSATLMNKGLELIEARWLFDLPLDQMDIVIHPEAVIHGLVEFVDGSLLAQLGPCDMQLPIQYALSYPERWSGRWNRRIRPHDLTGCRFEPPDASRFPCLALARRAAAVGGTMPAVLNAANEVVVHAFLRGAVRFGAIPECVAAMVAEHRAVHEPTLEDIVAADRDARQAAARWMARTLGVDAFAGQEAGYVQDMSEVHP